MRVGIAADHEGLEFKEKLVFALKSLRFDVSDFGAYAYTLDDDYPDFIGPLAKAVADHSIDRGIAICGSGVGACVVANKVPGVRAAVIHDVYSAHQGVEDDNMNVICLGQRVLGYPLAWELVQRFLSARFSCVERHLRRLAKIETLEQGEGRSCA